MALTNKLTAIADAIRTKTNTTEQMTLDQMPTLINGITVGEGGSGECTGVHLPESALTISGGCTYRFHSSGWSWFINEYGDKIKTKDINNASYMFAQSSLLEIPFDINIAYYEDENVHAIDASYMFYLSSLTSIPRVTGSIQKCNYMFKSCNNIVYFPDDWADSVDFRNLQLYQYSNASCLFDSCQSLRYIPLNLLKKLQSTNESQEPSRMYYKGLATSCYVLDELTLPVQQTKMNSTAFASIVEGCGRLKEFVFELQEDGTPYTARWKTQTIDLSKNVGYATSPALITSKSGLHGITADKEVKDADTYAALKDDPDWFTGKIDYCRYNHDSAVNTINTLPDTSAYLATAGGTNTIKFKGAAGELTDGGAINTLTEEEIAVATAKGWTVSFA